MKKNKIVTTILILIMVTLIGIIIFSIAWDIKPRNETTQAELTSKTFETVPPIQTSPISNTSDNNQKTTGEIHIDVTEQTNSKNPYIVGEITIIPGIREE